jgi:hypothetical protein
VVPRSSTTTDYALLDTAIQGSGAFRRFKDVLLAHPQERERWFVFQQECVRHRIRRWLESEDLQALALDAN